MEHQRDISELDHPRRLALQQRMWMLERIGWMGFGLFLLAAGLGAFGSGPLSNARAQDPDGLLRIEYARFVRVGVGAELRLRVDPRTPLKEVEIRLDEHFLQKVQIEHLSPEPLRTVLARDGRRLRFSVEPSDAGGEITVRFRPEQPGPLEARIALGESAPVLIRQFVYP